MCAENKVQHRVLASQGIPLIDICSLFSFCFVCKPHTFWGLCFRGIGGISSGKWRPDKQSVTAGGAATSVPAAARSDEVASILNFKEHLSLQIKGIQNCFLNEVKRYFLCPFHALSERIIVGSHLVISVYTSHITIIVMYHLQLPDLVTLAITPSSIYHVGFVNC